MKGVILLSFVLLASASPRLPVSAAEPPFGIQTRIPWTSSRLRGSPEPPLAFTVEKTFTNLTLKAPIYVAEEPGTDRLLVVQAGGEADRPSRILRFKDDPTVSESEVFLEVPRRLVYSVCFHPGYGTNGLVYVFSNGTTGNPTRTNRITRYTADRLSPRRIRPESEEIVIEWTSSGHDGGDMAFGLDGFFYVTTGDGSTDSDTLNSGQTMDDLLGNVLRLDVNRRSGPKPYAVPSDNPFVNTPGARPEIWAYGFRNPWRMSIARKTGQLWVGNNGQDLWETAQLVRRGENYGWSVYEGSHPFYPGRKRGPTPPVPPTIEHAHSEFRSLTGGVVYEGRAYPELNGVYIYGDYSSGRIWGMKHSGKRVVWHRELADTSVQIAAFRVDHRGDLLIVDHGGNSLHRLIRAPKQTRQPPFPSRLSETGLFASTKDHRAAPGLIPYSVIAPAWSDGALAERFMALPGNEKVGFDSGRGWNFPDGTALVETLSLDLASGKPASRFRVETRVLLRQQGEWAGYSYRWNTEQTDATLVGRDGAAAIYSVRGDQGAGERRQTWRFPSRSECMACHSRAVNYVLGISGLQMNGEHEYSGVRDNQLRTLEHIGLFNAALPAASKMPSRVVSPGDTTQELEARARAYLHVNCSVCHVEAGGGNAKMELGLSTPREKMNLIGARPQHDAFGIDNAMLVAPGEPDRSVLIHRLSHRGRGQMPPLVSARVDDRAVALMRQWISGLKPEKTLVKEWGIEDFGSETEGLKSGRSFTSGHTAFRESGCAQCHRFAGEGGSVGPDLSGVGRRLPAREILEAILLPSKVIADEYASHDFEMTDGETVSGRIQREDARRIVVGSLSSSEPAIEIEKRKILRRQRSVVSPMPAGMANVLQKEQVLDLLAYLISDGDSKAGVFR